MAPQPPVLKIGRLGSQQAILTLSVIDFLRFDIAYWQRGHSAPSRFNPLAAQTKVPLGATGGAFGHHLLRQMLTWFSVCRFRRKAQCRRFPQGNKNRLV